MCFSHPLARGSLNGEHWDILDTARTRSARTWFDRWHWLKDHCWKPSGFRPDIDTPLHNPVWLPEVEPKETQDTLPWLQLGSFHQPLRKPARTTSRFGSPGCSRGFHGEGKFVRLCY